VGEISLVTKVELGSVISYLVLAKLIDFKILYLNLFFINFLVNVLY